MGELLDSSSGVRDAFSSLLGNAALLRTLLDHIDDGVYFTDRQRRIRYWNKAAERITGYTAEEVVGHHCADNILTHVDDHGTCLCQATTCPLVRCFGEGEVSEDRVFLRHKEGHRVPISIFAAPVRDASGEVIGGVETFRDISTEISAAKEVEALKEVALLCPLTAVGNRRYCERTLATCFREPHNNQGQLGILFIDVDDFKHFNDTHGHAAGDRVLAAVARTLSKNLRAFDFVGRWGGEEFVAVLPRITPERLKETANRLRALVASMKVEIDGKLLQVTVSVGATIAREDDTAATAVARADHFMYASKRAGKDRITCG